MNRNIKIIFCLYLVVMLSACSTLSAGIFGQATPDEAQLRARVQARWDAMKKHDIAAAYGFLSPAYRKLYSLDHYKKGIGQSVEWLSTKILQTTISEDHADVKIKIGYRLRLPGVAGMRMATSVGRQTKEIHEAWLWHDQNWWYNKKRTSL